SCRTRCRRRAWRSSSRAARASCCTSGAGPRDPGLLPVYFRLPPRKAAMDLAIGAGAGFSGDRVDAPAPVVRTRVERGGPAAIIFEMLAERTLAFAQLEKQRDPAKGYEPLLDLELRPILADCVRHRIPIAGNFGAANPRGAAAHIERMAKELGLPALKIGVVEGDDL